MTCATGARSGCFRVAIAIPTYRRPSQLEALLVRLVSQADRLRMPCHIKIVVVDNDPDRSGSDVTAAVADSRLAYLHESRPGVAAVRNRALREAWVDDAVIFIDDDQLPGDDWLESLISTWQSYGCAAVAGPVVSELPPEAAGWIRAGGFFARGYRGSLRTGDLIDEVATTNLLLDMSAIRSRNLMFDERFGLSGGEDSLFTRSLTRSGAAIVWCCDASVIERVPAERLSRSWVGRRAISSGNGAARVRLALERSKLSRARVRVGLLASGLIRCTAGGLGLMGGVLGRSESRHGRSTRTFLRGLGMCLGSMGITYLEYSRDRRHWQLRW